MRSAQSEVTDQLLLWLNSRVAVKSPGRSTASALLWHPGGQSSAHPTRHLAEDSRGAAWSQQSAQCTVPATARSSQLEDGGRAGVSFGDREWEISGRWAHGQQHTENWIYCSATGQGGARMQIRKGCALCSQNSLFYGKCLRGIRLKPNQFLMDHWITIRWWELLATTNLG